MKIKFKPWILLLYNYVFQQRSNGSNRYLFLYRPHLDLNHYLSYLDLFVKNTDIWYLLWPSPVIKAAQMVRSLRLLRGTQIIGLLGYRSLLWKCQCTNTGRYCHQIAQKSLQWDGGTEVFFLRTEATRKLSQKLSTLGRSEKIFFKLNF